MRRRFLRTLAWKGLLYLFVAVVLAGVTRDLVLTGLLTIGFAAGDTSVAALVRAPHRTEESADSRRRDAADHTPTP
jgi:hypothetical protein